MSHYVHNQDDQHIPALIPLNRKKVQTPNQNNNSGTQDQFANLMKESSKKAPTNNTKNVNVDKNQTYRNKDPDPEKIKQFEKKSKEKLSTVNKKQQVSQNNQNSKENQKSKFLIAEMLNKLSIKNLTEQLYPVSNQVIQQLLSEIDYEIGEMSADAQKKQKVLDANPYNIHLKKQLETVKREIDHCSTIKQLYYEKINFRNKIQILQGEIINLRNQNRDLKVKVSRGIEMIENYKHNLPCERQKQLKEKLTICQTELTKEKEMRSSLEQNIDTVISNFKRLYEEADQARLIVTKKLKQIQERQNKLKKGKIEEEEEESQEMNAPNRRLTSTEQEERKSPSYLDTPMQATYRKVSLQYPQGRLATSTGFRKTSNNDVEVNKKTLTKQKYLPTASPYSYSKREDEKPTNHKDQSAIPQISLEDKIRKMRNNQNLMQRNHQN